MTDKIVTPAQVAAFKAQMTAVISVASSQMTATINDWFAALPAAGTTNPTDPPVTDFTPKLTVDVTTKPGSALLTWTDGPSGAPTGYAYGRNGVDTGGGGPWTSGLLPGTAHAAELDKLVPGAAYIFTVTASAGLPGHSWITSVSATIPASTGGGGGTDPQPGTGAVTWNSGVWTNQDAGQALAFAKQRGQALGNIVVFTSRGNWAAQTSGDWKKGIPAGFKGNLVIKVPLWTEDGNHGRTEDWQTLARQAAAVDPQAWVCLGWEMNLPSWYFKLTAGNFTQWVGWYRTAVMAMKSAAPGLRFAWNPNAGGDQTGGNQRAAFQQLRDLHVGYGPDSYDAYPADTNAQAWSTHLNAVGFLGESYQYATANGMQFVLPEWGVASGSQWGSSKGFDNPKYINDYLGFLKSKAKETVKLYAGGAVVPSIGFDSYFSEPASYLRSDWASNPRAAAAYAAQFATKP